MSQIFVPFADFYPASSNGTKLNNGVTYSIIENSQNGVLLKSGTGAILLNTAEISNGKIIDIADEITPQVQINPLEAKLQKIKECYTAIRSLEKELEKLIMHN